jgi:hypothetical protein
MQEAQNKTDVNVFIDESGSITKTKVSQNQYFVMAMLFTKDSTKIKRQFRKGIASLLKKPKFQHLMDKSNEIKGSEVSENRKKPIYDRILRNCGEDFELGIIVINNDHTTDEFIRNHARTFNYVLQLFLDNYFRNKSAYAVNVNAMNLMIDEQNIATDTRYTLDDYLEQQFTVYHPLCDHFNVEYVDSKQHSMIQLVDFIANTFYRNLEKHDEISRETVAMLKDKLIGGNIFLFPNTYYTKLFL